MREMDSCRRGRVAGQTVSRRAEGAADTARRQRRSTLTRVMDSRRGQAAVATYNPPSRGPEAVAGRHHERSPSFRTPLLLRRRR